MGLPALIRATVAAVKPSSPGLLIETISSLKEKRKYVFNSSVRYFYNENFSVTSKKGAKLRSLDGVPETYDMIYQSPMESYLKFCYPGMLFCCVSFPAYILFQYLKGNESYTPNLKENIIFINKNVEVVIYVAALCLFTGTVFSILFKTPFRIYKHSTEQKYIAIFLNIVPTKLQQVHFTTASQNKFNPVYFFLSDCQYLIGKRKVFLFPHCFRRPADFLDMLGRD